MRRPTRRGPAGARTLPGVQDPIPFVFCFDVEPDQFDVGPGARPWLGFERLLERVGTWRDEFAAATDRPVRFNWFLRMDPQIAEAYGSPAWVVDRYGRDIERLRSAGDLIGLHPHALRWSAAQSRWIADHADAEWIDHCIRVSYTTYEAAMGEPCRAQRFGDRFITARAARLTAELGARYDLTVEPGARAMRSLHPGVGATGRTADMRAAPRGPYHPSPGDPLRQGSGRTWMIPLTSMNPDPLLPTWHRVARHARQPGGPWYRAAPLTAPWPATRFWPMIERELALSATPYLAFAIRSDAMVVPTRLRPIEEKLAALLSSALVGRLAFTKPGAVVGEVGS